MSILLLRAVQVKTPHSMAIETRTCITVESPTSVGQSTGKHPTEDGTRMTPSPIERIERSTSRSAKRALMTPAVHGTGERSIARVSLFGNGREAKRFVAIPPGCGAVIIQSHVIGRRNHGLRSFHLPEAAATPSSIGTANSSTYAVGEVELGIIEIEFGITLTGVALTDIGGAEGEVGEAREACERS